MTLKGFNKIRIISFILCLSLILAFPIGAAESADGTAAPDQSVSLESLQKRYEQLEKEKAENEAKLAEVNGKISGQKKVVGDIYERIADTQKQINLYTSRIGLINNDIALTDNQISVINDQITSLNDKITATEAAIDLEEVKMQETIELLRMRLRATYMSGGATTIEYLLSSEDFSTLLIRSELIKRVAENDNDLMETAEEQINQLNDLKTELNADVTEQQSKKAELNEKNAALQNQKNELNNSKQTLDLKRNEVQGQYNEAKSALNELDKESEEYRRLINRQEDELIAASKEMEIWIQNNTAKQEEPSSEQTTVIEQVTDASGESVTDENGEGVTEIITEPPTTYSPPVVATGSFSFPLKCSCYVSSPFGNRIHPVTGVYKLHTGVDLASGGIYQQPIYAAQAGKVIYAAYQGAYGNFIIIDHGNNLQTCYAHCDSIACYVGQTVTQGQMIGRVGSTGNSTGPHLHFEVRVNGTPVSPGAYIALPAAG